ncbi:MAG TPA: fumarylacetoacetate hydrolase family protein [Polyangiaceae bacterium]|jgi:fumarylacetoacetate (FAA) hydrolase
MKLGTLRDGSRDGRLVVVRRDHRAFADASRIAPHLQAALDVWDRAEGELRALADDLESGAAPAIALDAQSFAAPLPRAYEWADGSAYLSHVLRVRRARNAEPPPNLNSDPLIYQGGSGVMLGPRDPISVADVAWGLDMEAEIAVVLRDTPRGIDAADAHRHVALIALVNDISLRGLASAELAKGFGFFQSKPRPAFAPFVVTPDELGSAWRDGRAFLSVRCTLNGAVFAELDSGGEMHFSFFQLMAHIARTRSFVAGTVLGGGTVSTSDDQHGTACIVERRALEIIATGKPITGYMKPGDALTIEAFDANAQSVFGRIEQAVVA